MNKLHTFIPALISIICCTACNTGSKETTPDAATQQEDALFTLMGETATNITFQNKLTEGLNTNILMYEYFYNGAGVAAGDVNNDGLVDLYFTSNMGDNRLYLNKGNLKFEDITSISGAAGRPGPWKTGVNMVDINGDGLLDIYVCYSGALPDEKRKNQLFVNAGINSRGTPLYHDEAEAYGLASTGYSNQAYFFDCDKDGDLDMLLLNHNPKNLPILNIEATLQQFKQDNPDKGLRLYKQHNGKFEDVTVKAGINGSDLSYGLGLGISDFNDDGWLDFYVSNDYAVPDFLYINNKNGTFTNLLETSIGHTSQFSMGNDVADINNDDLADIFTLDMLPEDNHRQKLLLSPDNLDKFKLNVRSGFYYQYMRNMLHLNNGNGTFSETGQIAGVSNTDWSWSALFADYDNDGWKDLYITNGYFRDYTNLDFINYMNAYIASKGRLQREDVMDIIKQMPSSDVVNYMFHNKQGGTFDNRTESWGLNQHANSNGAVYADLDNDGDLDLVVNNINQPAFVYRNEAQQRNTNHYLQVRLNGEGANRQGIGAVVRMYSNGQVQRLEQHPARGYLSSVSTTLHFGLGDATTIDSLVITWASGKMQRLYKVNANQVLQLDEKDAKEKFVPRKPTAPYFRAIASPVSYTANIDTNINDFNRQSLLISQFSYNGPCMVKADMNKDGLEDIIIGGSAGQATALYLQQKNGAFSPVGIAAFEADKAFVDADIAVPDVNADGLPDIYIASGGYHQFTPTDDLLQDRLYINQGNGNFTRSTGLPVIKGSKSCVSVTDINGDGFTDIFVGGRVVPGRYPETPESFLLVNDGKGNFTEQAKQLCPDIARAGMITDAEWVDLDQDNTAELVVVGEWMPVSVYKHQNGKLVNSTGNYFDKAYTGWWNKISVADINGDQQPDLVIGNFGLNAQFRASEQEPVELYYKDFDKNGSVDPIFTFYIWGKRYPFITRDELLGQLPQMRKRFADFKSYADVTMDELYGKSDLDNAGHLVASHMVTSAFISTASGKFVLKELPPEAQYAPVYTIDTLDVNADGNLDLLLCGNTSYTKIRLGKFDANYGVLLAGDGKGNFSYINQVTSGLTLRGDVRSCVQIGNNIYFGICGQPLAAYTLKQPSK